MWIYAKTGFVAIAKFNWEREGATEFATAAGVGSSELTAQPMWLVRARRQEDLEAFLGEYSETGQVKVLKLDAADYQYRALLTGYQLGRCMLAAVQDIDYDTLKKSVAGREDKDYLNALYGTWSETLWSLDERAQSYESDWNRRLFDDWEDVVND